MRTYGSRYCTSIAAGSMDLGHHELDYLAQAHWHHFHYRTGGDDPGSTAPGARCASVPSSRRTALGVTQARSYPYDILVLAVGT